MSRKQFNYADAETCRTGLMICGACKKQIVSGQFRYRDAGDRYVTHHRACSEDDENWQRLDCEAAEAEARYRAFVEACIAFRDEWQVSDLDHWIEA